MFIREVALFKEIPSHIIDETTELVNEENHPAGHVLFQEGDLQIIFILLKKDRLILPLRRKNKSPFQ